ncbi:hypothetical protein BC827DRAFT_1197936 [Russula dissimulans]|nr:hypothetical protein BC827DRAFT_1197936 [Russula dissimulans]
MRYIDLKAILFAVVGCCEPLAANGQPLSMKGNRYLASSSMAWLFFSPHPHYTAITGHAFIGAYTQLFHPHHTPEQVACQCGEPIQTVEHVLRDGPRYDAARRKHLTATAASGKSTQLFSHPNVAATVPGGNGRLR